MVAKLHSKRNWIHQLLDEEGQIHSSDSDLLSLSRTYYEKLFSTSSAQDHFTLPSLLSSMVSSDDNDHLLNCPGEDEIRRAVFSIDPNKAPGPNGFNTKFAQDFW